MNVTRYKLRLFSIAIVAAVLIAACGRGDERTAYFFYEAVCPSCEETQRLERLAAGVASRGQEERRTEVRTFDMFHATDEAFETIERLCRERGIELNTVCLPILFTNESVYRTADEIEGFLAKRRVLGTTGGSRYV